MFRNSLRFSRRSFRHLPRIALTSAILLLLVAAGVWLVLRFWVLPDIARYHGDISAKVSQTIGRPVIIGKIEADWRGLRPHLLFTDVRILDMQGNVALALPSVDNVLSWMTLLSGEIRLHSLELNQPDLLIRRDTDGVLHIADVALSSQNSGSKTDADWILHQALIIVRNARITWLDEQRAAPALVLNQVNLHMVNSGQRHSFSVLAAPPTQLSAKLDIRGDFFGQSFGDLDAWRGQLYTQLEYTDIAAWRNWLPLPAALKSGRGAVRGWMNIDQGKLVQVTADLALADVQTQLADDLPALDMPALRGRVSWRDNKENFEVSTRKLSLQMKDGLLLRPTDFYLRLAPADIEQASEKTSEQAIEQTSEQASAVPDAIQLGSGEVRANTLELQSLLSLTDYLPLQRELKQRLAEFSPRGTVTNLKAKWQVSDNKLLHYNIQARFDKMSLQRVGKIPGFSELSGEIEGSDRSGKLSLNTRKLTVDAPQILLEPLTFDILKAQLGWRSTSSGLEIKFNDVVVANEDLAGTFSGSYQFVSQSRGVIDLNGNLTRAAVNHTARYIPLGILGDTAHHWIREALLGGQADQFSLRMRGDLTDFPFDENRTGVFEIRARAKDVVLEYGKEWPRIEKGVAELLIQGKRLEVTATTAMTVGGQLKNVSVVLPDISSPDLLLQVRGEAVGETRYCLDFIRKSPVSGYIGGFTDSLLTRGGGHLTLQLEIPLRGSKQVTVTGSYLFFENDVNFGEGLPQLVRTTGTLLFTESSFSTRNVTSQILGGPAVITVVSGAGGLVKIKTSGRADMNELRKTLAHPLLHYLHGSSPWEAEISVHGKQADALFTSALVGLASDLPAPFAKLASEAMPLRIEIKSVSAQQEMVSAQYGKLLDLKLLRVENKGNFNIQRGTIGFGKPGKWPSRDGVWLSGTVPMLSLAGWETLFSGSNASPDNKRAPLTIGGIDLLINKVGGFGYMADNLRINARNNRGVLVAQLTSKEINGEVKWQPQGNGKVVARLKNLTPYKENIIPESKEAKEAKEAKAESPDNKNNLPKLEAAAQADPAASAVPAVFPALDVVIDSLALGGKNLGQAELLGQQRDHDWVMERLRIVNPDGVLTVNGKWQMGNKEQTQLNAKLEISNAGNILARSGYPNSVKRGSGKLEGTFFWDGGPTDFRYAKMNGSLNLDTGKGKFLEIDPGLGKLLSILSLQALPKYISMDFADVFSKGFAFDSIAGTAQIDHGVLATDDFKIFGSAAKVTMMGKVDLDKETQNLRVRVLPTVGNSVSLLGFVGGPVVGVGVYLANKILRDPLDKLVSFEYNVTGSWAEPNVVKVDRYKPADSPESK